MTKIFTHGLTIAICLVTSAMLAISGPDIRQGVSPQAHFAADGAFRDGLYLGKLAAQGGQPLRPAIGRWSTEQDRAMFVAGYRLGYSEVLGVSHQSSGRRRTRPATEQRFSEQRA